MDIFRRILATGKKHWVHLAVGVVTMILVGLVAVLPTLFLKLIADLISSGRIGTEAVLVNLVPQQLANYGVQPYSVKIEPAKFINWIPLILLVIFVIDGLFRLLSMFYTRYFCALITEDLRIQMHDRVLKLSLGQIRARNSGDLVSCLTNDLLLVQSLLADVFTSLIKDLASVLALGAWLIMIDWKLSLVVFVVLPAFFYPITRLFKKIYKLSNQGQESTGEISSFISETVQGADLIHLFNMETVRQKQFKQQSDSFIRIRAKQLVTDSSLSPWLGALSAVGIGFVIWFGFKRVLEGDLTVGDLSAYIVATVLLYQPVKRLLRMQGQINQIAGTCERVFKLIDADPEVLEAPESQSPKVASKELSLCFKNVSFAYFSERETLQEINLNIVEGEQIAIVGSSGSGKSTLTKLIPRLYDVTKGELEFNGLNVRNWQLAELRKQISFVPQDPFLFSFSLEDNLRMAKPEASEAELKKALELAKVDFLNLLQNGLQTKVGERGSTLSGGQRQRIAIARAFLKNSPLLILDEPTSSLDSHSEELIRQSITELRKNRTVILVTHKLNVVKDFNRIVYMKDGRIIDDKDPKQLQNKVYAEEL